jgi:hypothetical protein
LKKSIKESEESEIKDFKESNLMNINVIQEEPENLERPVENQPKNSMEKRF